jgi:hypothetical protein
LSSRPALRPFRHAACLPLIALGALGLLALHPELWAQGRNGTAQRSVRKGTQPPPAEWEQELLDLFFDDARLHLGPGQPGGGSTGGPPAEHAVAATSDEASPPSLSGGFAWSTLISRTTLEDEIKAHVQPTADATRTPSEFKGGGNRPCRTSFSVVAAMFNVISQFDGEVRWRKEAPALRSLFGRAGMNCKVGTDNSFKEAQLRSQDLAELVRGGNVELPKVDPDLRWADLVNRPPLMVRLEQAQDGRLKGWLANAGEFRKNKDAVRHEAQMIAALARIIQDPSYEYADDDTYLGYAAVVEQQAREIAEAVQTEDYQRASTAYGEMYKACSNCHEGYRS